MNNMYNDFDIVEHYVFKSVSGYILMDVNTLDVCILDEIENNIVKVLNKHPANNRLNMLIEKYGELIVAKNIDELLRNGILKKKEEKNETDAINNGYDTNGVDTINAIDILISEDCNLACKYCFVKNGQYRGKSALMKLDVGQKSIDFLIQRSGSQKDLFVCFFGGEPLINFKVLENMVCYAIEEGKRNNKQFHFSLTTNGTLLSDEIVEFIHKHHIFVVVSIDGDIHSHNINRPLSGGGDSYTILVNGLEKLSQRDISYSARATVSSLTLNKISENFEHLISLGFNKIHFENAFAPKGKVFINNKSDIAELKKQYSYMAKIINKIIKADQQCNIEGFPLPLHRIITKDTAFYSCTAGRGYLAIDAKGDIYLCHRLVGDKRFLLGNTVKDTYSSEWSKVIKTKMSVNNKRICKKCWARYICGGGCYAVNYDFNKDISVAPRIYCQLKKYSIKMALTVYANSVQ